MDQIIRVIKFTKPFSKYYIATGFFIILVSILNLVGPLISGAIVDIIVPLVGQENKDITPLIILLGIFTLTEVVITFFNNISGYIGDRLGAKLNTFLTSKFYSHVLDLQIEYFDNEVSGKIMNKLQRGIDNIAQFINQMLNNFLPFFLSAIVIIVFLAFYSIEIAVLLAVLFPIYIIISNKSSKTWMKRQDKINTIQDKNYGRIFEAITSIRVVKSFIREKLEYNYYRTNRTQVEDIAKVQSKEWHLFDIARGLVLNIVVIIIYVYIVYNTFEGRYTLGQMTLLLQLANQARFPLFAMSFILEQIQTFKAGSKDFFEVLNEKVQIEDKAGAKELKDVKGNVTYEGVTFSYKNSKEVLHDVSFELESGQKLALVGESGEGKSTIANLLLRFYEPQKGKIKIDGIDINDVTQESLHKNTSVVLQDSILFSGTIAENIGYGKENATKEEIEAAAKAANAHEFIMKFENGYDTEIGERGVKLSGGQKQRLSIARALLKDAPILILDEATSSLDSKAEAEVQKALNKLMEGRTTIIIAHRLATVRNVDKIVVVKGGAIAEYGSPAELLKKDGIYAELVKLQTIVNDTKDNEETSEKKRLQEYNLIG
jgi:ATP-binding cassette subfamily B protein